MHQEVLLPGHLLQQFFKEHLQDWKTRLKELFLKEAQDKPSVNFEETALVEKCVTKACGYVDVGKRMTYLLSTGNLASRTGMGQTQKSGFTIVAEKLNFLRYLSHFRSVHRGAYFQELRTTTARRIVSTVRAPSRARRRSRRPLCSPRRAGPQAAARLVGLHVPRAHAGRLAVRAAETPGGAVPAGGGRCRRPQRDGAGRLRRARSRRHGARLPRAHAAQHAAPRACYARRRRRGQRARRRRGCAGARYSAVQGVRLFSSTRPAWHTPARPR